MDAVSDVKSRLALEDVVAEYLELKPSGSNLKALSPFTQEKTASFMVSPAKQIWHDFSSAKGGDMFSFIMEVEGIEFKEALELLARKAGLDLNQYQVKSGLGTDVKKQLERALNLSARFYQEQLVHNKAALDYVTSKRKFNRQSIIDFNIGYAPQSWDSLTQFLRKKGIDDRTIEQAGLAVARNGRLTDMFRGRVLVALADRSGNPIGFTGRQLEEGDGPKYINTAQTPLYDKSRHVFGLHLAKQAIRDHDLAIVAEGNLDVVSAHQAGYKNVVATAGTAMTIYQLKQLKHLSKNVALAFDGDRAGVAATIRAIPLAQAQGISLHVIAMPAGQDPDEIISQNPAEWEKLVEAKTYAPDWLREYYLDTNNVMTAQGKKAYADHMMSLLKAFSDPVERDHYLGLIAQDIKSSKAAVSERFEQFDTTKKPRKKQVVIQKLSEPPPRQLVVATDLLALSLYYPQARGVLESVEDQAWPGQHFLTVAQAFNGQAQSPEEMKKSMKNVENFVKILELIAEERYRDWQIADVMVEADQLALSLHELKHKQHKSSITEQIRQAEETGNWEAVQSLLEEWRES